MSKNAIKGVNLAYDEGKENRCAREMGWYRACQLIEKRSIDLEDLWQMNSWFARHKTFKNNKKGCGYINWLMWGGDDGYRFTKTLWKKYSEEAKDFHRELKHSGRDPSRYKRRNSKKCESLE
jgi:hypothetical protein